MGLILDSSVLIAAERRGEPLQSLLSRMRTAHGSSADAGLSAVSVVELNHGVYRAQTEARRKWRSEFVEELCRDMVVHPVSLQIALPDGRIEGQQAASGIRIAFEDLVIGATALYLGFAVATLNLRHFQRIPNLDVVSI